MKSPLHILIIDDDADDRDFLAGAFTKLLPDARISVAENGEAALRLLLQPPVPDACPDIAFLDLHMPGISGYQVLEQLRATAHCARFPVMVISTSSLPSDAGRSTAAGATGYFSKPTSLDDYDAIVLATVAYFNQHA